MADSIQNQFLASLQEQLQASVGRAKSLVTGLTETQYNWKPSADAWSIAETLAHVAQTNSLYMDRYEVQLKRSKPMAEPARGKLKRTLWGKLLHRTVRPGSRKSKTPKMFRPTASDFNVAHLDHFFRNLDTLNEYLDRARAYDINAVRVHSPISKLVRMRMGETLEILVIHVERHLMQVADRVSHPDFPKS